MIFDKVGPRAKSVRVKKRDQLHERLLRGSMKDRDEWIVILLRAIKDELDWYEPLIADEASRKSYFYWSKDFATYQTRSLFREFEMGMSMLLAKHKSVDDRLTYGGDILLNHTSIALKEAATALRTAVQWHTQRDQRVCTRCGPLHGKIFTPGAAPVLPLHPKCRCLITMVSLIS